MRLLFLDFDGVLNSRSWLERRPSKEDFARQMDISPEEFNHDQLRWALRSIDPDAVAALNDIVSLSGARIVVSSTWRHMWSLPRLEWLLRQRGFGHHIYGATPDAQFVRERGDKRICRGEEIAAWLRMFDTWDTPVPMSTIDPRSIVIIDDESDMEPLEARLFQTHHDHGLRAADVERIVAMYL